MKADLSRLTEAQRAQVERQRAEHHDKPIITTITLPKARLTFNDFLINPGVWRPDITSALHFADYLAVNGVRLFIDREALDMGCGTGLQGIVAKRCATDRVVFSDIFPVASDNAERNCLRYFGEAILTGYGNYRRRNCRFFSGDLFVTIFGERLFGRFDTIIFNQPFFPGKPDPDDAVAMCMLDPGDVIQRFLSQAPAYLKPGGVIVMPHLAMAGPVNNPAIQGPKHGYKVETGMNMQISEGLQQGEFSVYELTRQ